MDETHINNEEIELHSLLEAIYLKYGYDFRGYSRSSLKRRVRGRLMESGLSNISELQHRVLNDATFFEALLLDFSINVTAMFRDPTFYSALRKILIPTLTDAGLLRVWCAGCATGEEVYSIAILLKELDLYHRTRIYATDLNEVALRKAARGIYPIDRMQEYTKNYQSAGGLRSLTDYFAADDQNVKMRESLKTNIIFSDHNLASDSVFSEMDVIVCRNVLIYFGDTLQDRVFRLFDDSLRHGGILCLGSKESARFNQSADRFEELSASEKIYRKIDASGATTQAASTIIGVP